MNEQTIFSLAFIFNKYVVEKNPEKKKKPRLTIFSQMEKLCTFYLGASYIWIYNISATVKK